MDGVIRIFSQEGSMTGFCAEHTGGVISLAPFEAEDGTLFLLSGSWDGTARMWDLATCTSVQEFKSTTMENGIKVCQLPNGSVATGSTGYKDEDTGLPTGFHIRLWKPSSGECYKTISPGSEGHTGGIRCLATVPNFGFLTSSNDGSAKLRNVHGDRILTMHGPITGDDGTAGFVMEVTQIGLNPATYVTAALDNAARVWTGSDLKQTIQHPRGLWCALKVLLHFTASHLLAEFE
jgi:phospholipase A-2-activating protein